VTIIGPQKNIRGFINELQEAYKDNRVYVVRDIVLEKLVDEIKNLNDEKPQKRSLSTQKRFSLEKKEENVESEEEKEKNIPLKRKKDYAIKILAFNDETRAVKATIEFDYVIYIGDEYRL
jgi:PAB1-binding protein PBP1